MGLQDALVRLSTFFRRKRILRFLSTFPLSDSTQILDVGGEPSFWADANLPAHVTFLNICRLPLGSGRSSFLVGDARLLPFAPRVFDIAFSNSVIEHVGTFQNQLLFAEEIRRAADKLWVETPAKCFPIEPHLAGLFIHYLPKGAQRKLARRFTLWGWIATDYDRDIDNYLRDVRLLTFREMKALFPDCEILKERWLFLTKAYIAVRKSSE